MTTKERLHKLVDDLSEREAAATLEYAISRRENTDLEEWGDLDTQMDTAMRGSLRELDEEEHRAGFPPWRP